MRIRGFTTVRRVGLIASVGVAAAIWCTGSAEVVAADFALDAALAPGPQPETMRQCYPFAELVPQWYAKTAPHHEQALIGFRVRQSIHNAATLMKFQAPMAGVYRFRISAYAHRSPDRPIIMTALVGEFASSTGTSIPGFEMNG